MKMAIIKMSQYKMYWYPEFYYERITAAMTVKRYETLQKYLHVTDNTTKDNHKNANDKLSKVRQTT